MSRGRQSSAQCRDCHKEINEDLTKARGFHSRIDSKKIEQCRVSHTDHKGRTFDITPLDIDRFDHANTEFTLKDAHLLLSCKSCHKENNKNFRLELFTCDSCHDYSHQGKLGEDCVKCHAEKSWKISKFDHAETDSPLKGKRLDLACQACHV